MIGLNEYLVLCFAWQNYSYKCVRQLVYVDPFIVPFCQLWMPCVVRRAIQPSLLQTSWYSNCVCMVSNGNLNINYTSLMNSRHRFLNYKSIWIILNQSYFFVNKHICLIILCINNKKLINFHVRFWIKMFMTLRRGGERRLYFFNYI